LEDSSSSIITVTEYQHLYAAERCAQSHTAPKTPNSILTTSRQTLNGTETQRASPVNNVQRWYLYHNALARYLKSSRFRVLLPRTHPSSISSFSLTAHRSSSSTPPPLLPHTPQSLIFQRHSSSSVHRSQPHPDPCSAAFQFQLQFSCTPSHSALP